MGYDPSEVRGPGGMWGAGGAAAAGKQPPTKGTKPPAKGGGDRAALSKEIAADVKQNKNLRAELKTLRQAAQTAAHGAVKKTAANKTTKAAPAKPASGKAAKTPAKPASGKAASSPNAAAIKTRIATNTAEIKADRAKLKGMK